MGSSMPRKVLVLLIFLLSGSNLLAGEAYYQSGLFERYGLFIHYNYNSHLPNFSRLPGVPNCCPRFREGSGSGVSFGVLYGIPVSSNLILSGRLGYYYLGGSLEDYDNTYVLENDMITRGSFRHVIDASLASVAIEPMLGINIFEKLFLHIGFNWGLLVSSSFSQREELSKPSNTGVFADTHTRIRNDTSGAIPDASAYAASVLLGVSYEFPLNKQSSIIAAPELFYNYGLNDMSGGVQWKINTLRLGIALKYSPAPPIELQEERRKNLKTDTITVITGTFLKDSVTIGNEFFIRAEEEITPPVKLITEYFGRTDTLKKAALAKPAAKLREYSVHSGSRDEGSNKIFIKQQFVTQAFPLLPVIYFGHNSDVIPARYKQIQNTALFSVDNLEVNPVSYHHNILNIIGSRLQNNRTAVITLNGFADPVTEEGKCGLALRRSENVRDYLVNVWHIDKSRIKIVTDKKNCYPEDITKTPNEYGYSENRRVRISSDSREILSPLDKKRYLETILISPAVLIHESSGDEPDSVKEWFLTATQRGDLRIYSDAGLGNPNIIEQKITEKQAGKMISGYPLVFDLTIKDRVGRQSSAVFDIPVIKDTSDIEVERLSLAIFKVSQNTLREVDKKAISDFLKDLKPGDTVSVAGYTDMLGSPDENAALSQRRADIVCDYINELFNKNGNDINIISCSGVGFAMKPPQIKSYELPEERFLSRTVQVEIRHRWR